MIKFWILQNATNQVFKKLFLNHYPFLNQLNLKPDSKKNGCKYCERFTQANRTMKEFILERSHLLVIFVITKVLHFKKKSQTNTPIDSRNRKYACKYCNKKFTQWHYAKTHERIHTGEKSYACNYCDKNFSHLRSLKQIKLFTLEKNVFAGRIATTKLQLKPVL